VAGGGKQMIIKPVNFKLSSQEILRLVKIPLDEDKEDAFLFLKEVLKPQIDQATRGRLVHSFEAP